jgi:hypothetical protein
MIAHDSILLSQILDSPNLKGRVFVFISSRNRVPRWYLHAPGSFSSLPTTHRATEEVFETSCTWGECQLKVKVTVTLRQVIYREKFRPGLKPLETHDQRLFFQLNPWGHSLYVIPSMTQGWVCLLWIHFAFVKCTYRTYSMLLKIDLLLWKRVLVAVAWQKMPLLAFMSQSN